MDFHKIKTAVQNQFNKMSQNELFCVDIDKDIMWKTYIESFPQGSNPMFRNRTEHDCSCCRQFVRTIGNAVAIVNGKMETIWDIKVDDNAYQAVANSMSELVKSKNVGSQFLHYERHVGTNKNHEDDNGNIRTWNHFFVEIPLRNNGKNHFCIKKDIATKVGEHRALHDVMLRSLKELTVDSIDTTLDLISQGSLYRGNEHKPVVDEFRKLKEKFDKLKTDKDKDLFAWSVVGTISPALAKIRNTAIGTLLVNLSEGEDLEVAVRKFEVVMAPTNYKRPVALVTEKMVKDAKKKIKELGLDLERRYATLTDISVNDIIFANRESKAVMKDDIFDTIVTKKSDKKFSKVETVSIDKFIKEIVPNVTNIEVMFENKMINNLVSVIAPVDKKALPLFKWDNNFSWSYNNDMADSIKERVKQAGGNVTGEFCCRLAWYNFDDLDFHMKEASGTEIYYGSKYSYFTKGSLDVDMNAGGGKTRKPVENIFYPKLQNLKEGIYTLFVHQFCKREGTDVGFEVEIDIQGETYNYVYDKPIRDRDSVIVAKFKYSKTKGLEIIESLPNTQLSKSVWDIQTQEFHKVNVFMNSPNYWGENKVGNKHYFFMIDGCVNDGQARGFFNEFLKPELDKHRKVIEIVGSKMKTAKSVNQLSGIGFSDTKRNELLVKVTGNITRTLKVLI